MKKVGLLIKPYLCIIFGALLFLIYLNFLTLEGSGLALGIVGLVLAVFYLAVGIVEIVVGEKLGKPVRLVFEVCCVALFPLFMFVQFLLSTIGLADAMGPTAWTIAVISMAGSLAFAVVFPIAKFVKSKLLTRISFLFGAIFTLVLLLDILFDAGGAPTVLGNVSIIVLVLYAIYTAMLFNSFAGKDEAVVE